MNVNPHEDLCLLFERSQFTHPELFIEAENVDYFEVVCDDFIAAKYRTGDESALHGFDGVLLEEFVDTQSVVDDHVPSLNLAEIREVSKASRLSTPSSRSPDQSNDVYGDEFEVKDTVTDDTDNVMNREHTLVKASKFYR
uniref:Gag-pol polyprotein n=1 Tax=Angiostrongylus cantonensis TaxID=6313 RepID=A0A0K0D512_ANGCA